MKWKNRSCIVQFAESKKVFAHATLLGKDCHAKAPAELKAFWPKEEQVTGRLSCFVVGASVLWWVDGGSKRRVRYSGDREFKHLYIV